MVPAPAQTPHDPVGTVPAASTDDSRRAELCAVIHLSLVRRDVVHHGVRVAAFGVELGVGVVFRDEP
jgi:hypothetical protein